MICILLYPSHISYFEKRILFLSPSIASCMLGSGVTSFSVYLLTGLKSWTILNVPSFFGTVNVECPYLESDCWMKSLSNILWTHVWIVSRFFCGRENNLALIVSGASFFKGIRWSHSLLGGNCSASFSEKTLACLWYSSGIVVVLTVSKSSRCFSAICCAIVTLPISSISILWTWAFSCSFATTAGVFKWTCVPKSFPSVQLISGLNSSSQGYPRISWSFPRSVMKNLAHFCLFSY